VSKSQAVAIASKPDAQSQPASDQGSDPERWLFVDGASAFGGHEVMLLRWLEELATQRAVSAFVLARRGSQLRREAVRHAVVIELPVHVPGKAQRLLGALRDIAAFVRAVWTLRPSVGVIAEGCLLSQPLFLLLARCVGLRVLVYVPLLQTSVSMSFGNGRMRDAIVRHLYAKLPHGWITITREQGDDFRSWAHVRQPILVLQNTVSRAIEAAGRVLESQPAAAADGPLRVVVLGRLEPHQKGLDTLLEHVCAHPELGRNLRLSFVGTGPFEAVIAERLKSDAALARWVSLEPWSPTIDVLRNSDLLLMTSRYEGVPLVMLEAMALGVPVVAPEFAGTRAFLARTCLFPAGDMHAAFQATVRLLDRDQRMRIVERNRAAFHAQASNDAFAAAVKALTPQIRALGRTSTRRRSAA
jgi:glycosyltransferase involved in cell wall biosynthesis